MKRTYINIISACCLVFGGLTACTDVWDEHYQANPTLSGDENLWELIASNPNLTEFAALLEATGYDTLLTKNRTYTVWAPTQMPEDFDVALLEAASDSMLNVYRKEIVENHIANFSHVAGGIRDKEDKKNYKKVEMLNGKSYDFTGSTSDSYKLAGKGLNSTNLLARNGVLHVVNGCNEFAANIWEQLAKEPLVSKLYAYLYKDYKREFNPAASVPGPFEEGKPTYLDSAFTESCRWFYEIGQLNKEDSSYTMYAPSDAAWERMHEMTKKYFVYLPTINLKDASMSLEQVTDSIAKEVMIRNFVFSNTVNELYFNGQKDTLISTSKQMFVGHEADSLKYNTIKEYTRLSNGELYVVDEVNYNPFTCWHDTLRVEGESLWYQNNKDDKYFAAASAEGKSINKTNLIYDKISKNSVGVFTPIEVQGKPTLKFYVNDILSGYYRVSIVLLPPHLINPADTAFIKPNKFNARLYYADGLQNSGRLGVDENGDGKDFISDPTKIDTIVLAECIKIPYSEYRVSSLGSNEQKTRLELETTITFGPNKKYDNQGMKKDASKWNYDNSYRIDQVLFEPIEAPEGE